MFDCQFPSLFNNQPYVSKAETANSVFPCAQEYWEAETSESWKMLIGPADIPPSAYYLHALNCCLLRQFIPLPPVAKIDNFGKIALMYALHTHIFEWRQACSMLNPNGFATIFGNSVIEIGDGLMERRAWLLTSLQNWHDCYWAPDISVSAILLYHLGFISIYVSLSDLHFAAGRFGNKLEGEAAEQSLKRWANSEDANLTMSHVEEILKLAHDTLAGDISTDSSFELTMGLFTGGLVSWAYAKLRANGPYSEVMKQVLQASQALSRMGSWGLCTLFSVILRRI